MSRMSLLLRLIVTSVGWIGVSIAMIGMMLLAVFSSLETDMFDRNLDMLSAFAANSVGSPGGPDTRRPPIAWQVRRPGEPPSEPSLVPADGLASPGEVRPTPYGFRRDYWDTDGTRLATLEREVAAPDGERLVVTVAAEATALDHAVDQFEMSLIVILGVLTIFLAVGVPLQVSVALEPLRDIHEQLDDVRRGTVERLPESVPSEILPLIAQINALIDHNQSVLRRTRTQVGNLAHAIKTPLAILANEAEGAGEGASVIREQARIIQHQIDRYLARVQTTGPAAIFGQRARAAPVMEDLVRALRILHADRRIAIEAMADEDAFFQGDLDDFQEILGNLLDNACKWAAGSVRVRIQGGTELTILVEDDGPGLQSDELAAALERGRRLDERVPGSGLGLAIVKDMVDAYRGTLEFGSSVLGGLAVGVRLPLAV